VAKVVLLVDDSEETRGMYALRLRNEGYQVLEAEDGDRGIRLATEQRPDLIFMNLAIPRVDGWTAISRLKQDHRTRDIPVVAISGFDEEPARARAEACGSDAFLGKPCEPSRVLEEVHRHLGPAAQQ
jgi:two-component system, cell cycle response regulator DivK